MIGRIIFCLLCCLFLSPLQAREIEFYQLPGSEAQIPIKLINNIPYVQARIENSEPYWFLIDTGVSNIWLNKWVAKRERRRLRKNSQRVLTTDMGGRTRFLFPFRARLRMGKARFDNVLALVNPSIDVGHRTNSNIKTAGTLGFSLFEPYLFTIDYPNEQLLLKKGKLPQPNQQNIFRTKSPKLPSFMAEINGKPVLIGIDSGASPACMLTTLILEKLMPGFDLKATPSVPVFTWGGVQKSRALNIPAKLTFGRYTFSPLPSLVSSVEKNQHIDNTVILGGKILRNFSVTFDQRSKTIRLTNPNQTSFTLQPYPMQKSSRKNAK